jgi:hypothetical protein
MTAGPGIVVGTACLKKTPDRALRGLTVQRIASFDRNCGLAGMRLRYRPRNQSGNDKERQQSSAHPHPQRVFAYFSRAQNPTPGSDQAHNV